MSTPLAEPHTYLKTEVAAQDVAIRVYFPYAAESAVMQFTPDLPGFASRVRTGPAPLVNVGREGEDAYLNVDQLIRQGVPKRDAIDAVVKARGKHGATVTTQYREYRLHDPTVRQTR